VITPHNHPTGERGREAQEFCAEKLVRGHVDTRFGLFWPPTPALVRFVCELQLKLLAQSAGGPGGQVDSHNDHLVISFFVLTHTGNQVLGLHFNGLSLQGLLLSRLQQ